MTRTIKPQFKDLKTCAFCGAPAEIIGAPWMRGGILDWFSKPVTAGGHTYSHCCTRGVGEDHTGKPSTDPKHGYECGAIQSKDTIRVDVGNMFGRCFDVENGGE